MLSNKKIVLGITGGIAAYKCAHLVRLFVKAGAEVRVVATRQACDFVTPQTLSVLSKNPVWTDFFDESGNWNNHVHLGEWADLMVIAPLTANTLAKMAGGQCDSILLATLLSARGKVFVAPAMDLEMYRHPSVSENLARLRSFGYQVIPAESGELASGLSGEGRMAEPENIVSYMQEHLASLAPLKGRKALVNAGPTYEPIDPVRFIGNHSSGRMGVAVAEALAGAGAEVSLVLGPSSVEVKNPRISVTRVESSSEMYDATLQNATGSDIVVCAAAVADYRPSQVSASKIKKTEEEIGLRLVKTKDILAELGLRKKQQQLLVGFALESENLLEYAKAKLQQKNLDMIVANPANLPGAGFGGDTNKITIIDKHNKITNFELKSKQDAAADIVAHIISLLSKDA